MGQAVVDLPDPLETAPPDARDADDLLAELAGEEIDRLLAEAEMDQPAPPAAALVPNEPPVGQQLEKLFQELQQLPSEQVTEALSQDEEESEAGDGHATTEMQADSADDDRPTTIAENVLLTHLDELHVPAAAANTASSDVASITAPALPIRLLQSINAPLARCSPAVHEAVGKVAILTLLNALAVIAYVLLFR